MKNHKYLFVFCMLLAIAMAGGIFTRIYVSLEEKQEKNEKLHVVTSFYPVYIAALNVAGESPNVELENLSEPQTGCMHDYQLTPQDLILLSGADLFLVNGGGIENFLTEVSESYPELAVCQASEGVELLEDNAHVWMDTTLYAQMVKNIAEAFCTADPAGAEVYQANAEHYCRQIQNLTDQLENLKAAAAGTSVVIFHEAYAYLAKELGMETAYCLDLDEERQVSAGEIADMMGEISKNHVSLVFAEELYGKDMGDTVEAETKARVCYLNTLVRGDYEAGSYLTAVQQNIDLLEQALEK